MIECEVKTGQIAESIENTRREGGQFVGKQVLSKKDERILVERMKEKSEETVESIENTRIKGGDGVGVKLNERWN